MIKPSAGLLFFRVHKPGLEVLLVHPGGPFWLKRDAGTWTIPKGEIEPGEDPLAAAIREVKEETGIIADGKFIPLSPIKQKGGKIVHAWAIEKDIDATAITSNNFEMVWPPKSGKEQSFPEIDKAGWFSVDEAELKILEAQRPFIHELQTLL